MATVLDETIAHVRENARIVIMCCAFAGPPKIVRLHGRARAVLTSDPGFGELRALFPKERDKGVPTATTRSTP